MRRFSVLYLLAALAALWALSPSEAFAASDQALISDGLRGFYKPFYRMPAVLTLLALGLMAGRSSGKIGYLLPVIAAFAFVGGAVVGEAAIHIGPIALYIKVAMILAGLLLAAELSLAFVLVAFLAGVIAFVHGYPFGLSTPGGVTVFAYMAGLGLAALALGYGGALLRWLLHATGYGAWARIAGGAVIGAGAMLFTL